MLLVQSPSKSCFWWWF